MRFLINLYLIANLAWAPSAWAKDLVIGSISGKPAEEIALFQPVVDYLAARLKDLGINRGRVEVAESMAEMADLIRERKVDIYIDSPFPVLLVSEQAGTQLRLRRWKGGQPEYRSVILAHQDRDISDLDALAGQTIALEDPFSTSGYLLPKAALVEAGLQPRPVNNASEPVLSGETGYIFSYAEENTVALLLRKRVAAAGMGSHDLDEVLRPWEREQFNVIHRTPAVPRHIVSIRRDLDDHLADRISELLKEMEDSEEGRQVMSRFQQTTRFDDIPNDAHNTLERLRPLVVMELENVVEP